MLSIQLLKIHFSTSKMYNFSILNCVYVCVCVCVCMVAEGGGGNIDKDNNNFLIDCDCGLVNNQQKLFDKKIAEILLFCKFHFTDHQNCKISKFTT